MLTMFMGNDRRNRMIALVLAGVLVASVILALLATAASAAPAAAVSGPPARAAVLPLHAQLASITPADGARLDTAPTQITLTFDEPVPVELAKVVLTRDGAPVEVGALTAKDASVTAPITGQLSPGDYRIAWRATSDDGHPVSGEATFTVTGPAGAAGGAVPLATPTYKTPQTQATSIGHPDHLPGIVVGGVLLLAGVALLIHEQRRRRSHLDEPIS
jgi:methionine-rich copper-binding protein CopC